MPDWFCPVDGSRLSYGIYCKKCGEEMDFALRPAGELERMIEQAKQFPAPPYPRSIDD
jgi:hypothetical protein